MKNLKIENQKTIEDIDMGGSGEQEEYVTTYEDITGDNIYEIKTITHRKEKNYSGKDAQFDFIWNNNFQINNYDIGLKFSSFSVL